MTTAAAHTEPGTAVAPAIEARAITKRFGAVVACDRVDLSILRGEIHGVLGQNGAGKTTLMNILLGLVRPDAGEILVDGQPVEIHDPIEAARLRLAMVHQHFSLIGPLTVWENVTLGEKGRVDSRATIRRVNETADRYGLAVDPRARVDDLTTGQRQRVEIVKCLMRDPNVLILDEPTSVLTIAESLDLFAMLHAVVRDENRAVVLISHKLDEILRATDRVTIMRDGAVVARVDTSATDAEELAREMIGRSLTVHAAGAAVGHLDVERMTGARTGSARAAGRAVLSVRDVSATAADGRVVLDRLNLDVHRGEIVGLAGAEGNGQGALGDLLSSLLTPRAGGVEVNGARVACGRPGAMAGAGVGVVPEDRDQAVIPELSVAENLVLGDLGSVSSPHFVSARRLRELARELVDQFEISTASVDAPMKSLSGGNQQRVVLARELSRTPAVLVAAQPTRGLDVGAIEYVTGRIRDAAAHGIAVLLISTELEELLELSDRIAVIHRGHVVGDLERDQFDLQRLGLMMGGQAA